MKRLTGFVRITILSMFIMVAALLYSNPVSAATNAPTEQEAYDAITSLRVQYYEGRPWTNDNYYRWNGGLSISGGYGCAGFAFACSDAAFKDLPARKVYNVTINDLHVGDILRIKNDSHSVVVLEKNSDSIVVTEGNFNNSIHWGRQLTAQQVSEADYMVTRYPVGSFSKAYAISFDANGGSKAPEKQYKENTTIRLTSVVPVRVGYRCEGWSEKANATTPDYLPGASFSAKKDTVLYAVWSKAELTTVASFPSSQVATISVPGSAAYYSITPVVSGDYTFSAASDNDTYAILYDAQWKKIGHNDDAGDSSDFSLTKHLDAGKTYYLCARYFLNDSEYYASMTGSFQVNMAMVPDVVVTENVAETVEVIPEVPAPQVPAPKALTILRQPQDLVVALGQNTYFSLEADGDGLSYQWYFKFKNVPQFSEWSGRTQSGFDFSPAMNKDGMQAYCVITDAYGNTVTSNLITLTVVM